MVVLAVPAKRSSSRRHKVRFAFSILVQVHLRYLVGRWPEKSIKFITRLLKNAESNADAKSLELENLVIKNIVVQQAPVCSSYVRPLSISLTLITENPASHIPRPWSH